MKKLLIVLLTIFMSSVAFATKPVLQDQIADLQADVIALEVKQGVTSADAAHPLGDQ